MATVYGDNGCWLFNPEEKIGKTKVLYKGDSAALQQLKDSLAAYYQSSDIFPYIGKDYDYLVFFYHVDPDFLGFLEQYCTYYLIPSEVQLSTSSRRTSVSLLTLTAVLLIIAALGAGGYCMYTKTLAEVSTRQAMLKKEIAFEQNTPPPRLESPGQPVHGPAQPGEEKTPAEEGLVFVNKLETSSGLAGRSRPAAHSSAVGSSGRIRILFADVGQGDAIIIISPRRKCVVIDSGKSSTTGKRVVELLKKNKLSRITALVMTHPHKDHIGGIDYILNNVAVDKVYDSGKISTSRTYKRILQLIKKKNIDYTISSAGQKINTGAAFTLKVLHPQKGKQYDNNNSSIVLRLVYKRVKVLFTGDAEHEAEHDMIAANYDVQADVIKVGHHGSTTSSGVDFLRKVKPKYAVIQVGSGNRYGHPKIAIIERYRNLGIKVMRTDELGDIEMITDGRKIQFKTSHRQLSRLRLTGVVYERAA